MCAHNKAPSREGALFVQFERQTVWVKEERHLLARERVKPNRFRRDTVRIQFGDDRLDVVDFKGEMTESTRLREARPFRTVRFDEQLELVRAEPQVDLVIAFVRTMMLADDVETEDIDVEPFRLVII